MLVSLPPKRKSLRPNAKLRPRKPLKLKLRAPLSRNPKKKLKIKIMTTKMRVVNLLDLLQIKRRSLRRS